MLGGMKTLSVSKRNINRKRCISDRDNGMVRKEPQTVVMNLINLFKDMKKKWREVENIKKDPSRI